MKINQKTKMFLSGLLGFSFFLIANFTDIFKGINLIAAIMQLLVNTFVFIVWLNAFRKTDGLTKFIAFWGIIVPLLMATITVIRVIVPSLIQK